MCVQATIASCTIPFFSAQGFGRRFRGMRVLDGGITDNTPVFKDNKRRQIVFQLTEIAYPFSMSLRYRFWCDRGVAALWLLSHVLIHVRDTVAIVHPLLNSVCDLC